MFELLEKYKDNKGCFVFTPGNNLKEKCIASFPHSDVYIDCCGVYIVYGYKGDKKEVVYIGSSGHMDEKNEPVPRKGGLRRRIYGRQKSESGEHIFRNELWAGRMAKQGMTKLEISWYNTGKVDNPLLVEYCLILEYVIRYKRLPAWNNELKLDSKSKGDLEDFINHNNIEVLKIQAAQ